MIHFFVITVVIPEIILEDNKPEKIEQNNPPMLSINGLQSEEKSRRFSQLPPAPTDSPNAVKVGNFAVIPTIENTTSETVPSTTPNTQFETSEYQTKSDEKENHIIKIAEPDNTEKKSELVLSPGSLAVSNSEKSRRFSKLPPADVDSPNAVKLGSKFTMISREDDKKHETEQE